MSSLFLGNVPQVPCICDGRKKEIVYARPWGGLLEIICLTGKKNQKCS